MDRVRKKFVCSIFVYVFIISLINSKEPNKKELPLLSSEVLYDFELMYDAQKDNPDNKESYGYSQQIIKQEKLFLEGCNLTGIDNDLSGKWELVDKNGKLINHTSVYFDNTIMISKKYEGYTFDNWGNRSTIYKGEDNRLYIYTRWICIIRLIIISDDKLYVYIIKNGKWVLDPIHENGQYFFTKF